MASRNENRDDFSEVVKRTIANRVGNHCSNPDCRALTSGPHSDASKALNVGVACHMTAAAPGGPRYDASLTPEQRASPDNAIWLCQPHGKLIDNDAGRYPIDLLKRWKAEAEARADAEIGRGHDVTSRSTARTLSPQVIGRQIKRELTLKKKMEKDFLRRSSESWRARNPWAKFLHSKVFIRDASDTTYAKEVVRGGTGPWFSAEIWDFYAGGLEVIVLPQSGIIDEEGRWDLIDYDAEFDRARFRKGTIVEVGQIPWRNITFYDMDGDNYNGSPHIYCHFSNGGWPYESYTYYWEGKEHFYLLEEIIRIENSAH